MPYTARMSKVRWRNETGEHMPQGDGFDQGRKPHDHMDVESSRGERHAMQDEDLLDVGVRRNSHSSQADLNGSSRRSDAYDANGSSHSSGRHGISNSSRRPGGSHSKTSSGHRSSGGDARTTSSRRGSRKTKVDFSADPWEEERAEKERTHRENAARRREDDEFGIDDLAPMSGAQKAVLFVVILLVVVAGYYIFNYRVH